MRKEKPVTESDIAWLKHHFARPITIPHATIERNFQNIPIVVRMSVFGRSGPCPTLYWLVEPDLLKAISRLEAEGLITTFEQRLRDDEESFHKLCKQHSRYQDLRWEYSSQEEKESLAKVGIHASEALGGIGGIKDFRFIKCLHLHYAHYFATGDNLIGQWVDSRLP